MQEHLDRRRIAATVTPSHDTYLKTKYALSTERPMVSIVIPTRDNASSLQKCLESICQKTDYRNYEVIVIDNESCEAEAFEFLATLTKGEGIRVERIEDGFNYSRLNNRGVEIAGEPSSPCSIMTWK